MKKELNIVFSDLKSTFIITFNYIDFVMVLKQVCRKHKINHNFNTFWFPDDKKDFAKEYKINNFLQIYFIYANSIRKEIFKGLKLLQFESDFIYHSVHINHRDAIDFLIDFNHPHHENKIYKSNFIDLKQNNESLDMPPNWQDFTHTSQLYENAMYYI